MLQKLINPASIAVIGASNDTSKPGGKLLENILIGEYTGQIYPINPKYEQLQGLTAYASVRELPAIPDIALIAIPAPFVRQALVEVAEKGVEVVVVLSSGFGELGAAGKAEEEQLACIAEAHNMLMLGPNCSGILTYAHASKFTGFVPHMIPEGVDIISGSGAMIDFLAEQAVRRGIPLSSFLTIGNAAHSGITELLTLFDEHYEEASFPVKLLYAESITDPPIFLQHARSLSRKGCMIAGMKAGISAVGRRAAASHTGAMATNDNAIQALFDKAGLIRVHSRQELIDIACALVCTRGNNEGKRVCIISDAGGPAVLLSDELAKWNLEVPPLKADTQTRLAALLPPGAAVANPIDCLPTRTSKMVGRVIELVATKEADQIDYFLLVFGDPGLTDIWEMYDLVIRAMDKIPIPILPTFCSILTTSPSLYKYRQAGKCFFEDEVAMGRALGRILTRPRITEPVRDRPGFDHETIAAHLHDETGALSPQKTRALLTAAGLRFPRQQVVSQSADLAAVDIPFPWALKVVGPLHKSDVGGVHLDINNLTEAYTAWESLCRIEGATGVLVQELVTGLEVIMGASREEEFGHLVLFGLGGIFTEALRDVNFCLAPLSVAEAEMMIQSSKAFPLLQGLRGQPGMDVPQLTDWLIRLGLLVHHFPQITEMDLNPVKGLGSDLSVVDARIIVA